MNRQCQPATYGPVRYGHTAGFTRVNRNGYRRLDEDYRRMRIYYRKKCQHAWWFGIICKIVTVIRKIIHTLAMLILNILFVLRDFVRVYFKVAETVALVPLQILAAIGYFVARHSSKCNRYRCIALRPFLASFRLGGVFTHSHVDDAHSLIRWPGATNFRPVYRRQFRAPPNLNNCSGCNKTHMPKQREPEQPVQTQQPQQLQMPPQATTIIAPQFGAAPPIYPAVAAAAAPPPQVIPYAPAVVTAAPPLLNALSYPPQVYQPQAYAPPSIVAPPSRPPQRNWLRLSNRRQHDEMDHAPLTVRYPGNQRPVQRQLSYNKGNAMASHGSIAMRGGMPGQYNGALWNDLRIAQMVEASERRLVSRHLIKGHPLKLRRKLRCKLSRKKQPVKGAANS